MADTLPAKVYAPAVHEYKYELDTTPSATAPTWSEIGKGIDSVKAASKDKIQTEQYLSDHGFSRSEVYGVEESYTLAGKRVNGDTAQDYVFSETVKHGFGNARHSHFKITSPIGDVLIYECTLANIADEGGKTVDGSAISFEILCNGAPAYTAHTTA